MRTLLSLLVLLLGLFILSTGVFSYQESIRRLAEIERMKQGTGIGRMLLGETGIKLEGAITGRSRQLEEATRQAENVQTMSMVGITGGVVFTLLGLILVATPGNAQKKGEW